MTKAHVAIFVLIGLVSSMLFADDQQAVTDNLLKFTFQDADKDGIPDGYSVKKKNAETATVVYDKTVSYKGKGSSVKITLPQEGTVRLDMFKWIKDLQPDKEYLFSMNVKIKDMLINGKWYKKGADRCFIAYIFGNSKTLAWMALHDNGSTDGWVTIMCPFRFSKGNIRISLRCKKMSGTVWIQNPTILELAEGIDMDRHFILEDGSVIKGQHYKITK